MAWAGEVPLNEITTEVAPVGPFTYSLCATPRMQFFGNDGLPLAGGCLYTFSAGTAIPKTTYKDASGGEANTNPVVLDSAGRASIWLQGYYYMELWTGDKDAEDTQAVLLWTQDNVSGEDVVRSDLSSTDLGKGASLVGVHDVAGLYSATTVEAALYEEATERIAADAGLSDDITQLGIDLLADFASTTAGEGAALVGINDAGTHFASTTVEAALQEEAVARKAVVTNLAAVTTGNGAALVGIEDAGTHFAATTVEAALQEEAAAREALATSLAPTLASKSGATASVADNTTITHGFGSTPTVVTITGSVAGTFVAVTAVSSTTFTVAVKASDGTTEGTPQTIYWRVS